MSVQYWYSLISSTIENLGIELWFNIPAQKYRPAESIIYTFNLIKMKKENQRTKWDFENPHCFLHKG